MTDHLKMSLMLQITANVDDVIESYRLKLPSLNASTMRYFKDKLSEASAEGEIKWWLNKAVDYYQQLHEATA